MLVMIWFSVTFPSDVVLCRAACREVQRVDWKKKKKKGRVEEKEEKEEEEEQGKCKITAVWVGWVV